MITRLFLAASLALCACPALADTTAVYATGSDDFSFTMTVEIADSGEVRVQMGGPLFEKMPAGVAIYGIFKDGEDFIVNETPEGVSVFRISDAMKLMAERRQELKPQAGTGGIDVQEVELVARGERVVNGRTGTAYYKRDDAKMDEPVLIVSRDPALAQLGREMARRFGHSAVGMQAMGFPAFGGSMLKVMEGGAPLAVGGLAELRSVQNDSIPAARFALPAPPKPLEELRVLMTRTPEDR